MPKLTIKNLQTDLNSAVRNAESYRIRNIQVEKEFAEAKAKIEELNKQIIWHKQLNQNLSEAVCAYMRGRY